jgi:cytidine deaminase
MDRLLLEYRLDSMPFGTRAMDLLWASADRLQELPSNVPGRCAAALLSCDGVIHIGTTELILGEPYRHAVRQALLNMFRTPSRKVLMASILRRSKGGYQLVLPCGLCRMALYAVGGPDISIVQGSSIREALTIIDMNELLPFADGGPGRDVSHALIALPKK